MEGCEYSCIQETYVEQLYLQALLYHSQLVQQRQCSPIQPPNGRCQIYTYPIKSLRGISLPSLPLTYTGFPHDRRFTIFNVKAGKHMAVATYTEMCLFTTRFQTEAGGDDEQIYKNFVVHYAKEHVFDHPDQKLTSTDDLVIALDPETQDLTEIEINMHYSPVMGYDMGAKYNTWFSERFGYEVKLVYIGGNHRKVLGNVPPGITTDQALANGQQRGSSASWLGSITSTATSILKSVTGTEQIDGVDRGIAFSDVAPYLVINTKSWENASSRLEGVEMDISKFRPNIIVEGADQEWEEDYWAELGFGSEGTRIILTQNCARCNSLNVDFETGKVGEGEGGKMLKKLQSDRRVDKGAKYSPVFGRYGFLARIPEGKEAPVLKVGDEVNVLRRNSEHSRFGKPCSMLSPNEAIIPAGDVLTDVIVWPNLSTDS
jgi:uncharacterized protein YcbX